MATASSPAEAGRAAAAGRYRWVVVALLCTAMVFNYVDRQTLSALAPTIQRDLAMDDRDYADVLNLFLVAYTIAYLISGRVTDVLGTRAGMALFVCWWSLSNALTAAAGGVRSCTTTPSSSRGTSTASRARRRAASRSAPRRARADPRSVG